MDLKKIIPILEVLPTYKKLDFRADLIAGITVAIMLVPQGMAYAFLAGLPPIYGLYGGLIPLVLYAIFGTSRQMSIGPVAVSALLVLAGVSQLADPGTEQYISLVLLAGLLIGLTQMAMSLLRMGFLVNFISHPVIIGFTSAAAIIIGISQLKDLLGFDIPRFTHSIETLQYAIEHITQTNWISVLMAFGAIVSIILLKKLSKKIPGPLILVIASTLLTWGLGLFHQGLEIVGEVPKGLPSLGSPDFSLDQIQALVPTVLTVTIIGIVESIGIAKVLEAQHQNYTVRPNNELFALGISKVIGSFFQALPTSGSFTRSAINNEAGAVSGFASITTAAIIALTLMFLTPLFYYLPKAVLAAIILLAVRSLFNVHEAVYLWRTDRQDFLMMMITFFVTLILGIEEGVMAGVVISIMAVLYRSSTPHIAELGNFPGTRVYRNVDRFSSVVETKGALIIRFDQQLYFGNAFFFKEQIQNKVKEKKDLEVLILDASGINHIDSSGIQAMKDLSAFLENRKMVLLLCGAIGPVRDRLFKSGLMKELGLKNQFINVHAALQFYVENDDPNTLGWTKEAIQSNFKAE